MNLKQLAQKAGLSSFYALSAMFIVILITTSCQKNGVGPATTSPGIKVTASNTSQASAPNLVYKFSGPISLTGITNLTIRGDSILAGAGPAISLTNCSNIHITKSRLLNGNNVNAVGIYLIHCTNVTIDSCFITNVASGVYAVSSTGVNVNLNQMQNMVGPFPRGQFVQFNGVSGANNKVTNNMCENISGKSNPEDAISMYMANGTSASPIIISGNSIRGGGPSKTGGGIMLGDNGGSYQIAENNKLVSPGQYGIAVSAGYNMQVLNNDVYSAKTSVSNVGVYVDNQYTSGCSIVVVNGNLVNWTNSSGASNGSWNAYNCGTVADWSSNTWNAPTISSAIMPTSLITMK